MNPIKIKIRIVCLLTCLLSSIIVYSSIRIEATSRQPNTNSLQFTSEEQQWLNAHQDKLLNVGLDPYSGMDYFTTPQGVNGYLIDCVQFIEEETGLTLHIVSDKNWSEAFSGLFDGQVDILFGANPTIERLQVMSFTQSIHNYPYIILSMADSNIRSIGDLDGHRIGFLDEDMVITAFPEYYSNINFTTATYATPTDAITALNAHDIDGFITSGGEVSYSYLYNNPEIKNVTDLQTIKSEMTFSTLRKNEILRDIIDKVILHRQQDITQSIDHARAIFLRKTLNLTYTETSWLSKHTSLKVGVPSDYLPIDYLNKDTLSYQGIAGVYLSEMCHMLGVEITPISGTFDELYEKIKLGDIDFLDMAKTDDREKIFTFTKAFSTDRDAIYGLKKSPTVYDVYGLEDTKVAVINGFWHEEYLHKNLKDVTIYWVNDIQEALKAIHDGKANYFIENSSVADFYIEGLGYSDIIRKGTTSSDSFLYFGASREATPFVDIFNRASILVDYEKAKYEGIRTVPTVQNLTNQRLFIVLLCFLLLALILIFLLVKLLMKFIKQKSETNFLKQRAELIYTDALTGTYNRLYYYSLEDVLSKELYPHGYIMLDLNDLKKTNDTFGHNAGDLLIRTFTEILLKIVPHSRLMRMGGDEFLIVLTNTSESEIIQVVSQIKEACNNSVISLEDYKLLYGPTASVGYALRENEHVSAESILHLADQSMYLDKQAHHQRNHI